MSCTRLSHKLQRVWKNFEPIQHFLYMNSLRWFCIQAAVIGLVGVPLFISWLEMRGLSWWQMHTGICVGLIRGNKLWGGAEQWTLVELQIFIYVLCYEEPNPIGSNFGPNRQAPILIRGFKEVWCEFSHLMWWCLVFQETIWLPCSEVLIALLSCTKCFTGFNNTLCVHYIAILVLRYSHSNFALHLTLHRIGTTVELSFNNSIMGLFVRSLVLLFCIGYSAY